MDSAIYMEREFEKETNRTSPASATYPKYVGNEGRITDMFTEVTAPTFDHEFHAYGESYDATATELQSVNSCADNSHADMNIYTTPMDLQGESVQNSLALYDTANGSYDPLESSHPYDLQSLNSAPSLDGAIADELSTPKIDWRQSTGNYDDQNLTSSMYPVFWPARASTDSEIPDFSQLAELIAENFNAETPVHTLSSSLHTPENGLNSVDEDAVDAYDASTLSHSGLSSLDPSMESSIAAAANALDPSTKADDGQTPVHPIWSTPEAVATMEALIAAQDHGGLADIVADTTLDTLTSPSRQLCQDPRAAASGSEICHEGSGQATDDAANAPTPTLFGDYAWAAMGFHLMTASDNYHSPYPELPVDADFQAESKVTNLPAADASTTGQAATAQKSEADFDMVTESETSKVSQNVNPSPHEEDAERNEALSSYIHATSTKPTLSHETSNASLKVFVGSSPTATVSSTPAVTVPSTPTANRMPNKNFAAGVSCSLHNNCDLPHL